MTLEKKRRPRVGIAVGNYQSDHPIRLVRSVYELLKDKNVDVRIYLGTESGTFLRDHSIHENKYDYQYASLYEYSEFDDLDAMILSIGTIPIFQKRIVNEDFLKKIQRMPLVLMESDYDQHDGCYVISDNYQAEKELIIHLIDQHQMREIGFIAGPEGNRDATIRKQAYLDVMKEYGLSTAGKIVPGNFTEHVESQVNSLMDQNPDMQAIVCANDEMALCVYRICEERGLQVGRDIAVVGYDDIERARYLDPPLTTCRQDYDETIRIAVDCVRDILDGKEPENKVVPTKVIYRGSCGCERCRQTETEVENKDETKAAIISNLWREHKIEHQPWMGALLLREMMSQAFDEEHLFTMVAHNLIYLETPASYITLLDEPLEVETYQTLIPKRPRLVMSQKGMDFNVYASSQPVYMDGESDTLSDYVDTSGCFMTFLLFYENYQYGTLSVRIRPEQISFYYMLSLELGSALRFMYLDNQNETAQKSLKAQNNLLDFMASHDELTGLFNRAGIIKEISTQISKRQSRGAAIFMADMDHLKQINDTFGHPEGDVVIRKAADVLRSQMGDGYLLGRIGGDEYMGYLTVDSREEMEARLAAVRAACDIYNQASGKPYNLTISIGYDFIPMGETADFFQVYHDVDQSLYQAKKKRKASCLKEENIATGK